MWKWVILGAVALVWEVVGILSHKRWRQPDPWGPTSLTWLIVRAEVAHRWTRWPVLAFLVWLVFHFEIQHRV